MGRTNTELSTICKLINNANKLAFFCHVKPDADSLGSALALCSALRGQGKICKVYCDSEIGERFSILPGAKDVSADRLSDFDLYVALDCGDMQRLGAYAEAFSRLKNTVNIDHHPGNDGFAAYNYHRDYASTAEIVLELLDALGIALNDETARLLIAGILTDTGGFTNTNTDSRVLAVAARILKYDVDLNSINFALRRSISLNRMKLLGNAFNKVRLFFDGRLSLFYTTLDDLKRFNCSLNDTDGFVENALNIETSLVGVSISEDMANRFQVSMRSKKGVDVSQVCAYFGGGGHKVAAGCVIHGFLEDVIEKIVRVAGFELDK